MVEGRGPALTGMMEPTEEVTKEMLLLLYSFKAAIVWSERGLFPSAFKGKYSTPALISRLI